MKVLHICKVYLPTQGGVQVVVDWIANGLNNRGVSSNVLSTSKSGSTEYEHNKIKVENARSFGDIFSLPIAPSIITKIWGKANSYDIVCVHYPFPLADIALALMPVRKFRLVVYWHSEIVSQKLSSLLILPFTKLLLHKADKIVCSSPNLVEHSIRLKSYRNKCEVIPFGMPRQSQERHQEKPSQSTNFLFIGRHVPYKGIGTMIRAFARASEQFCSDSLTLTIVGNGPLIREHKQLSQQLGQCENIEFISNAGNSLVNKLTAECRCLLLPSTMPSEAFALVQIEAMSYGKPIINTNLSSGVPWVARDNQESITVSPGNEDELSNAILKLANNDDLLDELGASAKLRFNQTFSYEQFCSKTEALYRSLVDRMSQ